MNVKLLKPLIRDSEEVPAGAVIEMGDATAKWLIGSGGAEKTEAHVTHASAAPHRAPRAHKK